MTCILAFERASLDGLMLIKKDRTYNVSVCAGCVSTLGAKNVWL